MSKKESDKQPEVESAEDMAGSLINVVNKFVAWDLNTSGYNISKRVFMEKLESRDAAMMEKGRREQREKDAEKVSVMAKAGWDFCTIADSIRRGGVK